RQQLQIRRHTVFESIPDPPTTSWWQACLFEPLDRTRGVLMSRGSCEPVASVNFWNMETMVGAWGVHAVGIVDLEVLVPKRRTGLARYLLGEALRQLQSQGVSLAETHVPVDNGPALALFRRLGFNEVDQSVFYRKD